MNTNTTKIHTAIWLFADVTRGFLTGRTTPAEHAQVVEAARSVQKRMPEVEAQVDTVDGAIIRWWDDSDESQREMGADEDDLHAYFGHLGIDGRDLTAAEMIERMATVTRAELGLPEPAEGVISARVSEHMATMCAATLDVLDHCDRQLACGDRTDPAVIAGLREIVMSLHRASGSDDGSRLEIIPAALQGTYRRFVEASTESPKPGRCSVRPHHLGVTPRVAGQLATVCQIADTVLAWAEHNIGCGDETDPATIAWLREVVGLLRAATDGASPAELEWLPSCVEGHLARMVRRAAAHMAQAPGEVQS
ncbi:MAG: hypothetical protein ABIQ16_05660 [Polyangiaceae bacterium]